MIRLLLILTTFLGVNAMAAMKSEVVEYKQGDTVLEGYLAHNPAVRMRQAAIILIHDWMGMSNFMKQKADELAKNGFVVFAADIYGKGVHPSDTKAASELAGKYKADRKLLRARAQAALDFVLKNPKVDGRKVIVMGYCFGGTTALELAMSGAPLAGVVSFHGGLDFSPDLADVKNVKAKLLILHGAVDPFVPMDQVNTFLKALNDSKVDYQFTAYSGAAHAFTIPTAGNDVTKGAAYNAVADRRSTEAMKGFVREVLQ